MRDSIETTNVQGSRNAKATEASFDTFYIINWNRILYTHQSLFKNLK